MNTPSSPVDSPASAHPFREWVGMGLGWLRRVAALPLATMLMAAPAESADALKWSELPELPPAPGKDTQPGVAGPFAGVHNDALIVAGGANFPDAPPWRGGKKVWHADVFVLQRTDDGYTWHAGFDLPRPLGYGVAVSTDDGVLCIGGCDARRCYRDVFLLKWNSETNQVTTEDLPPLPRPLAFMAGARVEDTVFVAGGQSVMQNASATKSFFAFDLKERRWKELAPWPGPARVVPLAAGQSDGKTDCFYLFSGRKTAPGKATVVLADAYKYNPRRRAWKKLGDIVPVGEKAATPVQAGTAVATGARHVLVISGDDGKLYAKLDALDRRIKKLPDGPKKDRLESRLEALLDTHPGFLRTVLSYDTVTDRWAKVGRIDGAGQVTTCAVKWGDGIVIPSGEIRPGVRSPVIRYAGRTQ